VKKIAGETVGSTEILKLARQSEIALLKQ
jgi:hypothetical protein